MAKRSPGNLNLYHSCVPPGCRPGRPAVRALEGEGRGLDTGAPEEKPTGEVFAFWRRGGFGLRAWRVCKIIAAFNHLTETERINASQ